MSDMSGEKEKPWPVGLYKGWECWHLTKAGRPLDSLVTCVSNSLTAHFNP